MERFNHSEPHPIDTANNSPEYPVKRKKKIELMMNMPSNGSTIEGIELCLTQLEILAEEEKHLPLNQKTKFNPDHIQAFTDHLDNAYQNNELIIEGFIKSSDLTTAHWIINGAHYHDLPEEINIILDEISQKPQAKNRNNATDNNNTLENIENTPINTVKENTENHFNITEEADNTNAENTEFDITTLSFKFSERIESLEKILKHTYPDQYHEYLEKKKVSEAIAKLTSEALDNAPVEDIHGYAKFIDRYSQGQELREEDKPFFDIFSHTLEKFKDHGFKVEDTDISSGSVIQKLLEYRDQARFDSINFLNNLVNEQVVFEIQRRAEEKRKKKNS